MTKIIILRENLLESILKDFVTFGLLFLLTLYGIWTGSGALQWMGGIAWILYILSRTTTKQMTIDEARAYLDKLESE